MEEKAILYCSNAGHAERYATLLSKEVGLPAYRLGTEKLEKGTPVVFVGWIMAGTVKGLVKATKKYDVRSVAAVGMSRDSSKQENDIRMRHHMSSSMKLFYLQGGMDLSLLKGVYHFMIKMMADSFSKKLESKKDRSEEEDEILQMAHDGKDCVSAEHLSAMVAYLKG
mgnify:CR=1 FL=1|jgi:hypothetical protein